MKPTTKTINDALQSIEAAERNPNHPRSLARLAIARFRSDAERQGLATVNRRDTKGAALLDVRRVLNYEHHDLRLGRR
jgi:hypothetical protein